jgi:streptogramin lyase
LIFEWPAATLAGSVTVGTLNVQIQEYEVPTPKSRPHDPAGAPDGSLWCTGQGANKLGRRDPKTGEFKEYPLKTPNSGPHGLVADKDGNIWFTAISGGYVAILHVAHSGRRPFSRLGSLVFWLPYQCPSGNGSKTSRFSGDAPRRPSL